MGLPKLTSDKNFTTVEMEGVTLQFSYQTLIAFWTEKSGLVIRKNEWGKTTGKHLNTINKDIPRVDGDTFANLYEKHVLGRNEV